MNDIILNCSTGRVSSIILYYKYFKRLVIFVIFLKVSICDVYKSFMLKV